MSDWGDYSDYGEGNGEVTFSEMMESLRGDDRDAFKALVVKAVATRNSEHGGLIAELREKTADLEEQYSRVNKAYGTIKKTLAEANGLVDVQRQQIADLRLALGTTDNEWGQQLIAENKRLLERVEIQRTLIARLQGVDPNAVSLPASPWKLFKDGLSSAFASPLTAIPCVKAN